MLNCKKLSVNVKLVNNIYIRLINNLSIAFLISLINAIFVGEIQLEGI